MNPQIASITQQNESRLAEVRANLDQLKHEHFRLKVGRIDPAQGPIPIQLAIFDKAVPRHLSSPETWLPNFAGGGVFHLLPITADSEDRLCGLPLTIKLPGAPITPTPAVVDSDTWSGPPELHWIIETAGAGAVSTGPQRPVLPNTEAKPPNGNGHSSGSSLTEEKVALAKAQAEVEKQRLKNEADLAAARLQAQLDETRRALAATEAEAARKLRDLEMENERRRKLDEEATNARLLRLEQSFEAKLAALRVEAQAPVAAKESKLEGLVFDLLAKQTEAAERRAAEQIAAMEKRAVEDVKRAEEHARELQALQATLQEKLAAPAANPQLKMLDDTMQTFGKIMQHSLNMMQVTADLRGPGGESTAPKNPTVELIDSLASAGDKLLGKYLDALKLRGMASAVPGAVGKSGAEVAAALQGQPRQLPPGPVGQPPAATPPLQPLNAKPALPDRHVMTIIKLISVYTPAAQLGRALDDELENSRQVGDDFHKRATDFGVIFAEAAPHLEGWFNADPVKAKAYLDDLQAAFAAANAAEAAKEGNGGGTSGAPAAPMPSAAPVATLESGTPLATERNPIAPE